MEGNSGVHTILRLAMIRNRFSAFRDQKDFHAGPGRKTGLTAGAILLCAATLLFGAGFDAVAQSAAEYAGAVSGMASVGAQAHPSGGKVSVPSDKKSSASAHLTQSSGATVEDANRKELERDAGEDAGKLLLRSEPTSAVVWVEGKRIGSTPILLLLSPGRYRVELRGSRMEYAERRVDLQPRETREIVVPLEQRYPSQVRLR